MSNYECKMLISEASQTPTFVGERERERITSATVCKFNFHEFTSAAQKSHIIE